MRCSIEAAIEAADVVDNASDKQLVIRDRIKLADPGEQPHRINLVQRLLHARIAPTHITAAAGGCAASSPSHTATDPRDPNAGN
ncbi:hypothetical protein, partial [Enterobacter hormaechei]|uniref:hypothetical protein n=1 Tax=Enterobacter hormaechei TaxID=158836 RepID=UPI003CC76E0F